MLARERGDEIERHARRVRDRLVLVPHQLGQRAEEIAIVDHDFVRVGADGARDLARVFELVERAVLERDREGLQRTIEHPRHERRDRAAVDAAREEHAERDIGHQAQADRFFEQLAEARDRSRCRVRGLGGVFASRKVPVLPVVTAPFSNTSRCPGSSLRTPLNSVSSPDSVARAQHFRQHAVVRLGLDQPAREQRLDLRSEQQPPLVRDQ